MISAAPPPRPASVNSSILPLSSTCSTSHKITSRCTSADIHNDDVDSTQSLNVSFEYHPTVDTEMQDPDILSDLPCPTSRSSIQFEHLPFEIHEAILDHIFGERASASGNNGPGPCSRSWVKALRHPRRKALSNLSLISPLWRTLVQERIFRHSEYNLLLECTIADFVQSRSKGPRMVWPKPKIGSSFTPILYPTCDILKSGFRSGETGPVRILPHNPVSFWRDGGI